MVSHVFFRDRPNVDNDGIADGGQVSPAIAGQRDSALFPVSAADLIGLATAPHAGADLVSVWRSVLFDSFCFRSERMITARIQDHVVQTVDGALHLVINTGYQGGLVLLSSHDHGRNWDIAHVFSDTDRMSSADLRLAADGIRLLMVYMTENDRVALQVLEPGDTAHSWETGAWTLVGSESYRPFAVLPTVAVSDDRTIVVGYTEEVIGGLKLMLRWSDDGGNTWSSAQTRLQGEDAGVLRVLATGDIMGALFATGDTLHWIHYDPGFGWRMQPVAEIGTAGRFASHFTTTTLGDDIFMVGVSPDCQPFLMRLDGVTGTWGPPTAILGPDFEGSNAQISASADGNLYVVLDNADNGLLVVLESTDAGANWTIIARLEVPARMGTDPARFETPEMFDGDLFVFQQVDLPGQPGVTGLYQHVVDVDDNGFSAFSGYVPDDTLFL